MSVLACLLDGASDKHKIAIHLQNCHNYLIKYEHGKDIGVHMSVIR